MFPKQILDFTNITYETPHYKNILGDKILKHIPIRT